MAIASNTFDDALAAGFALRANERWDEAHAHWANVVQAYPEKLQPKRELANVLLMLMRFEEAEAIFRQLAVEFPRYPAGLFGLGRVAGLRHHWAEATRRFKTSSDRFPRHDRSRLAMARCLANAGHEDEARRLLKDLLRDDPESRGAGELLEKICSVGKADIMNLLIQSFGLVRYLEYNKVACEMAFSDIIAPFKSVAYLHEDRADLSIDPSIAAKIAALSRTYSRGLIANVEELRAKYEPGSLDLVFFDPIHVRPEVDLALKFLPTLLKPDGFLIVHDTNPPHENLTTVHRSKGGWMGETYKAYANFHRHNPKRSITIDEDYGVGIAINRDLKLDYSDQFDISYEEFAAGRAHWNGLISYAEFDSRLAQKTRLALFVPKIGNRSHPRLPASAQPAERVAFRITSAIHPLLVRRTPSVVLRLRNTSGAVWGGAGRSHHFAWRWMESSGSDAAFDPGDQAVKAEVQDGDACDLSIDIPAGLTVGSWLLMLALQEESIDGVKIEMGATDIPIEVLAHDEYACGQLALVDAPAAASPGSELAVTARLRNEGRVTWPAMGAFPVVLLVSWATAGDESVPQIAARCPLPREVFPGDEMDMSLALRAPEQPGQYVLQVDVCQTDVFLFSRSRNFHPARQALTISAAEEQPMLKISVAMRAVGNEPRRLYAGLSQSVRVELTNTGPAALSAVGAQAAELRWSWSDQEKRASKDRESTPLSRVLGLGEKCLVSALVRAPRIPGCYRLEFSLAVIGADIEGARFSRNIPLGSLECEVDALDR